MSKLTVPPQFEKERKVMVTAVSHKVFNDIELLIILERGVDNSDAILKLQRFSFDYAPVKSNNEFVGLISTDKIKIDPDLSNLESIKIIELPVDLDSLISSLEKSELVICKSDLEYTGFITKSDLNKHVFRSEIYSILAEAEMLASVVISNYHSDPWEWISKLNEGHQVNLIGNWEVAKRKDVEVDPINYATLAQMLSIIESSSTLREALGYTSKRQFHDKYGRLATFRNKIMHPVRPLILEKNDLNDVHSSLNSLINLVTELKSVLPRKEFS